MALNIKKSIIVVTAGLIAWLGYVKWQNSHDEAVFKSLSRENQAMVLKLDKDTTITKEVAKKNVKYLEISVDALKDLDVARDRARGFINDSRKQLVIAKKTVADGAAYSIGTFVYSYEAIVNHLEQTKARLLRCSENITKFDKSSITAAINEIEDLERELKALRAEFNALAK